ncbi:MAG TPA: tripartite tricarboxylate transporter substrate-binding protein [Pseudolabrys sp.]|nr:tripartite tricarboxylate transporter substrate-binding protein [Pseudolabrys sp.]
MTKLTRRTVIAGLGALMALPARAEEVWPSRPITLVHGFPPGGPVDVLSRILADGLTKKLGQPVVVEAKPGAAGTTAAGLVARAAPDGYTLTALGATFTAASAMYRTLPYNPSEDFTFISTTAEYPLVLVTYPDSDLRTVADIVKLARSRSEPLLYGTAGNGTLMHLTMALFAKKANIRLQHVPYKGGLPAVTDLLGKRLDLVLEPPTVPLPFVKDNKLRAIAVTSAEHFFALPDCPTMIESGYAGFVVIASQGVAGPSGLPAAVTAKVNRALAAVLADRSVVEKLKAVGNIPRPSSPQEYRARVVADVARWNGVIDGAHIARI